MISYDDLKEGVKNGTYRSKLRELFPKEMSKMEEAEKETGALCCGVVLHHLGMIHFEVKSRRLTREQLL